MNLKFSFYFPLALLFVMASLSKATTVTIEQVVRPDGLYMGEKRMAVTQGTAFFLYDTKDYRFIGKFGRQGEGPEEFKSRIDHISIVDDQIMAGSRHKVIFYSLNGEYRREVAAPSRYGSRYTLMGKQFAGNGLAFDQKRMFQTINIYDGRLIKTAEVYRTRSPLQRGGEIEIFHAAFDFVVCGERVFVTGREDFHIEVFDKNGKSLPPIIHEYERIDITDNDKREVLDYFRTLPETRSRFDQIKQRLDFPSRFPAIRHIYADDQQVYVQTYKMEAGNTEFFVFDGRGRFQRRLFLRVVTANPLEINPIAFRGNCLYQLVEIPDGEWELRIIPL